MSTGTMRPDVKIILRHVDPPESVREYAMIKLGETIYSVPGLRSVSVEITYEATAAEEQRYVVQVTLAANGNTIRVEERGPDVQTTTNVTYDVLGRRFRDWKGLVYHERRREGTAQKEAEFAEATKLPPEDKGDLIVRKKSHEIKPMSVEDAIEQMEMLGHDFFFFLNAETEQYNVVYRRRAGGYGWIVPAFGDLDTSDLPVAEGLVMERE
jgi:putative sigma-54 modulation protein